MGELLIGVFEGEDSASRVLGELRASGTAAETVASAGTVSVGDEGAFAVQTTDSPGSRSGFSGIFWEALFGLILLVHVPGSSYGPNTGALFGTVRHAGVDEAFRTRARRAFTPGTSAVGLLAGDEDTPALLAALEHRGATTVRSSLSADQDAALARELGRIP
jgi:uncharacterized membrane protein